MAEVLTINFYSPIPVFPLPDCVLLPHITFPLHVFENRYRTMVKDSLDSDGLIAMALFSRTLSTDEYLNGSPNLRPCVCVGHIRQYEMLRDGRYLLLLQGTCRARIVREVTHAPYRKIVVEPSDLENRDTAALMAYRTRIQSLANDPVMNQLDDINKVRQHLEPKRSSAAIIDGVIASLFSDKESRYMMLAETNSIARATWLIRQMESIRAGLIQGS